MSIPMSTFLRKMARHDDVSVSAAESLHDYSQDHGKALSPHTEDIGAYLDSSNLALAGMTAQILGKINTKESLSLLISTFKRKSETWLLARPHIPGERDLTIAEWILQELGSNLRWGDDRDDALHGAVIAFFVEVAFTSDEYPARVQAAAMESLWYYTQSYLDDIRGTIKFPKTVYEAAKRLANRDDSELASHALKMVAHMTHRIDEVAKVPSGTATRQRIDFDKANLEEVLMHYGPYRFADVHPEDFEKLLGLLFSRAGFAVEETPYIGDYGADFIASKGADRIAVQVKRYATTTSVSVGDVNQVIGARHYYNCNKCLVVTTSGFTRAAREMAKRGGVITWDWKALAEQIKKLYGISLSRG